LGRTLALFGLTLGLTLVVDLFLLSAYTSKSFSLIDWSSLQHIRPAETGIVTVLGILVLALGALGFVASRLSFRTLRGWIYFMATLGAVVVAGLWLVALDPTAIDGFRAFHLMAFGRLNQLRNSVLLFTACALGLAILLIRPRPVRRWIIFGLSMVLVLVCAQLVITSSFPRFPAGLFGRFGNAAAQPGEQSLGIFLFLFVLFGAIPLLIFSQLRRLQRRSWWWVGGGYLALAPVLIYLAADDSAIRRPVTVEEIAPAFPGAEQSFAVLMRYGKDHALGRHFREPHQIYPQDTSQARDPAQPEKWTNWLLAQRKSIEAGWAELAPVRAWWAELNAFDRIGDLTPARPDGEIPAFSPIRSVTMQACAIAGLQALDGHGDEAMATVLPILEVSRKLQLSARTLVRDMIGVSSERLSLLAIGFVLDHATISPPMRARLIAALSAGGGGAAGARRLVAIAYTIDLQTMVENPRPLGDTINSLLFYYHPPTVRHALNLAGPFLYNPRATLNLYGEFMSDLQELFARREMAEVEARTQRFFDEDARPQFKNFMGREFIRAAVPVYTKVGENYWRIQDLRTALLARVSQP
jgi:hypothetical protein